MASHKLCCKCGANKPLADFRKQTSGQFGRASECRDCKIAREHEWRKANPEVNVRYYRANRKREKERVELWVAANKARKRASINAWRKANPDRCRAVRAAQRARKRDQFIEDVDPLLVLVLASGCCGICSELIEGPFHVDHVIPLSKGGMHGYVNVQAAHPRCNISKGARLPSS